MNTTTGSVAPPASDARRPPSPPADRARLIVLVGAAGSGKSSWAAAHYPAEQVLSLDALRGVVAGDECDQDATPAAVELLLTALDYRLGAGLTTVVDATNARAADRARLTAVAARHRVPVIAGVLDTPLEVCLARNALRPGPLPGRRYGRRVPEQVLIAQYAGVTAGLAHAFAGEGFTQIWRLPTGGLDEHTDPAGPVVDDVPRCRVCGCTDDRACPGGCWWVQDPLLGDLCSACAAPPARSVPDLPTTAGSPVRAWFGPGDPTRYAVHPRRLLEAMPVDWQTRWVAMIAELEVATADVPQATGYLVEAVELAGDLTPAQRQRYGVRPDAAWYELVQVDDPVPVPDIRPLTPLPVGEPATEANAAAVIG
jgi:predicted kinase